MGNIGAATSWLAAAPTLAEATAWTRTSSRWPTTSRSAPGRTSSPSTAQNEFFSFENVFYPRPASASGRSAASTASLPGPRQRSSVASRRRWPGPNLAIGAQQFGLYVQDQWSPSGASFTIGLQADIPLINSPRTNPVLLASPSLPINTGDFPNANILWSPRLKVGAGT